MSPAREDIGPLTRSGSIRNDDWVIQVAPEIESRMAQYEEGQIEFAIMSLVKEPLADLMAALAENVKSIISLSQRLSQVKSDWKDFLSESTDGKCASTHNVIIGPCEQYQLYQESINQAELPPGFEAQLKSDNIEELLSARQELLTAQAGLRASIRDEAKAVRVDNERAASRRNDRGLLVTGLLQVLERIGRIESLFDYDGET